MNNNQIIIAGALVLLLIIGGAFYFKSAQNNVQPAINQSVTSQATEVPSATEASASSASSTFMENIKQFTVTGSNYNFEPAVLTVNKGDTVKIIFKNSGGMHNLVLDDFNIKTKTIQSGADDTITFTANKTGTFEYYCSVGNHRAMGMKGSLTVQ